ncbi:hypothetical protein C8R46DRAFT_1193097 [Mycena filopes]|nr:hypothetical protein C8R46DRAFT_1193097 [Mycena filopes]
MKYLAFVTIAVAIAGVAAKDSTWTSKQVIKKAALRARDDTVDNNNTTPAPSTAGAGDASTTNTCGCDEDKLRKLFVGFWQDALSGYITGSKGGDGGNKEDEDDADDADDTDDTDDADDADDTDDADNDSGSMTDNGGMPVNQTAPATGGAGSEAGDDMSGAGGMDQQDGTSDA